MFKYYDNSQKDAIALANAVFDELEMTKFHYEFLVNNLGFDARKINIYKNEFLGNPNAQILNPQDFKRTKIKDFELSSMKPTELLELLNEFKNFCIKLKGRQ